MFASIGLSNLSKKIEKNNEKQILLPSQKNFANEKITISENLNFKKSSNLEKLSEKPVVEASSAILWIPESGEILYAKNISERRQVGSLMKIFVALYSVEKYQNLDEILIVPNIKISAEESQVGLFPNDKISVRNLLRYALIVSGNDASWTLSGGYKDETSKKFVNETNTMIKNKLKLKNTNLVDPSGIDAENQFSTAFDIANASFYLLQNDFLKSLVNTKEFTAITSKFGTKKFYNTNQLLSYSYLDIRGIKTGTTDLAGPSLSAYAKLHDGNSMICVVLNSPNRFQECKNLLSWGSKFYEK
ncbi:MAG: hypothetical protein Fur0024_1130 [Patescibacteria group bacterium]